MTDLKFKNMKINNLLERTIAVLGQKGTGKTTFLSNLALKISKKHIPLFIIDPVGTIEEYTNFKAIQVNFINDLLLEKLDECYILKEPLILILEYENYKLIDLITNYIYRNFSKSFVIIDEISEFLPQFRGFYSIYTEKLIKLGRNKKIGVAFASQRPQTVSKNVLALGDFYILFRMVSDLDVKTIRDILRYHLKVDELRQVIATLHSLKAREFIYLDFLNF